MNDIGFRCGYEIPTDKASYIGYLTYFRGE